MRANNLQVGDKIVAVYDRSATRRQAAGHRSGDRVETGRFVGVGEVYLTTGRFNGIPAITVEEVRQVEDGIDVRFRDNWYGPYTEQDVVEVIRNGEVL